jgi:predicted phage tail protein
MKKYFKRIFEPILKYFQNIENIEAIKKEEYVRGCTDTAIQFAENSKKQNDYISKLTIENLKNTQNLEKVNLEHEQNLRDTYNKRIQELEDRHSDMCKSCKSVTDEERKRLNRMQDALAQRNFESGEMFMKLFKVASRIAEEHSTIMQSTARAIASKNELTSIKNEMDVLVKKSDLLLTTEISQRILDEVVSQEVPVEIDSTEGDSE